MKRQYMVAIAVVACAASMAVAQTSQVTSVNIVGYTKIAVPPAVGGSGSFILSSLNFSGMAAGTVTLLDIFGTNQLKKANGPTLADRLYFYNAGSATYDGYYQKTTGDFYLTTGAGPTNRTVMSGDAFWIQSANNSTTTNFLTVMGEVVLDISEPAVVPVSWSQFGSPYAADLDINGTNVDWIANGAHPGPGPTLADRIYVWNGAGYDGYFLRNTDNKWHTTLSPYPLASNALIRVGADAWYYRQSTTAYTNIFNRPFSIQ